VNLLWKTYVDLFRLFYTVLWAAKGVNCYRVVSTDVGIQPKSFPFVMTRAKIPAATPEISITIPTSSERNDPTRRAGLASPGMAYIKIIPSFKSSSRSQFATSAFNLTMFPGFILLKYFKDWLFSWSITLGDPVDLSTERLSCLRDSLSLSLRFLFLRLLNTLLVLRCKQACL